MNERALKERAQLLLSYFPGWPLVISRMTSFFFLFFFPSPLLYEIESAIFNFYNIEKERKHEHIKAFGNGPVFIKHGTVWIRACGSRGFNPFHLSLIARQRDTTDSLNIFEQSKTRLIPCIKCGTFIGPVVLTRRRSSIVRVFYRSSFFFFFPSLSPTISLPDPLINYFYGKFIYPLWNFLETWNIYKTLYKNIKIFAILSRYGGKIKRGRKYALIISPRRETNMTSLTSEITRNRPFPSPPAKFESSNR